MSLRHTPSWDSPFSLVHLVPRAQPLALQTCLGIGRPHQGSPISSSYVMGWGDDGSPGRHRSVCLSVPSCERWGWLQLSVLCGGTVAWSSTWPYLGPRPAPQSPGRALSHVSHASLGRKGLHSSGPGAGLQALTSAWRQF